MSEPLPLPQEPGIDCISFQLNTQEAAAGKVLTCLDSAGNANWGTGGSGGGISTLVVTGDTSLPNSTNNVLINASSGSVITLMLPASPTNGTFYNIIQPNNVKVVLVDISMAKTFNIAYINMTTSSFSNFIGTKYVYIPNFNLNPSGPFITYSIIYDSSNTTWKTLNLGNAPLLSTITNNSTLVANRLYGMYQERNTIPSPIVLTFTNQDNIGRVYTGQTIGLSSNKLEALIKINGSVVSSGVTNGSGILQFNTVSNSATTFNAQITCSYGMPMETAPNTSSVTIAFSVDASTMTTNKTDVSADGKDYAEITATIKDANNNLYSGKTISFSNLNGISITINPGSDISNSSGESKTQISSNTIQTSIIIQGTNTTDGYILPQTVSLNFINPDPIPTYGTVYAWYRWSTYNDVEKKWYDYYNQQNNGQAFGTPIKSELSKLVQFLQSDGYEFSGNAPLPSRGTYIIRARKIGITNGRIINGSGVAAIGGRALNNLLGWHDFGMGWAYLTDAISSPIVSPYIACGQASGFFNQFDWNIFVFRASNLGTTHCFVYKYDSGTGTYSMFPVADESPPNSDTYWQYCVPTYYAINRSAVYPEESQNQISDFLIYDSYTISDVNIENICAYLVSLY